MRRVIYSVAMSLDGYIAGPGDEFDWIPIDPEIDFDAMFARFDTLIMGRRTFSVIASQGSETFTGKQIVVFSRTLDPDEYSWITVVSDGVEDAVTRLRQQPGRDIWLYGGGELFRSALNAGLVDGVEVAVIPILVGEGRPLLPPTSKRTPLRLTGSRVYSKTGTVWLEYAVG